MQTADGKIRVYLHDDQTAQIADEYGRMAMGERLTIHRMGERLAELGVAGDDLLPA